MYSVSKKVAGGGKTTNRLAPTLCCISRSVDWRRGVRVFYFVPLVFFIAPMMIFELFFCFTEIKLNLPQLFCQFNRIVDWGWC